MWSDPIYLTGQVADVGVAEDVAQGVVAVADAAQGAGGGGEDLVGQAVEAVVAEDFLGGLVDDAGELMQFGLRCYGH